jgi:hypothetical protein
MVEIEMYALNGECVFRESSTHKKHFINTFNLPRRTYLVFVRNINTNRVTAKKINLSKQYH